MGEDRNRDREDKNRSTQGTSRRFEMGTSSKLATRNKSVKNKQIPQREFSQNDVLSQKSFKVNHLEDSIGVIGASINKRGKPKNVSQTKPAVKIMKNDNKSPDIVSPGVRLVNQYSSTKSQASITNNNFAKFSSSGYTNNAFLLMSGHHDFNQNDFQQQSGSNFNMDANQINSNLKSTSQTRVQNKNYVNKQDQEENIEESIIEEDIQTGQNNIA